MTKRKFERTEEKRQIRLEQNREANVKKRSKELEAATGRTLCSHADAPTLA
jgi:hypothetical protein